MSRSPFLADARILRTRIRRNIDQALPAVGKHADRDTMLALLADLLSMEIICVLRYRRYRFATPRSLGPANATDFVAHADEEQEHADRIAERIFLMGGEPDFSPSGLESRSQSAYLAAKPMMDLIKEDMIAECIAMDSYRDVIHHFGECEPVTRKILETILAAEQKHAVELADLLQCLPA